MFLNYKNYGFKTNKEMKCTIVSLYDSGLTQSQICLTIGCSKSTIIKAFKIFKIKSERRDLLYRKCSFKTDKAMATEFNKLYSNGMSQRDIARKFGVSIVPINLCFKRHKLKTRTNSQSVRTHINRLIKPTTATLNIAPLNITLSLSPPELDIIGGLLLGSGQIDKKGILRYDCNSPEITESIANGLRHLKIFCPFKDGFYRISTNPHRCLIELRKQWYATEGWKQIPENFKFTPEACYWWHIGDTSILTSMLRLHMQDMRQDLRPIVKKMPVNASCYMADEGYLIIIIPFKSEIEKFLKYIGPCRHPSCASKWQTSPT